MKTKRSLVCSAAILGLLLSVSGGAQVLTRSQLQSLYGKRWVVLPLPDSRIAPGAIVSIKKTEVAWESNLSTCGAPADVLSPVASNTGQVTFTRDSAYDAKAVVGIKGVEIGPEFNKVKRITLTSDQHGPEGLDRIALGTWFNNPATKLSPACASFLTTKNVFIVQEAYKVAKGHFKLFDQGGARLKITGLNLGIVKFSGEGGAKATNDGDLEFGQPVYTAIRRLQYFKDGSLKTLGSPGPEKTADDEAKALLAGTSAPK